MLRLVHKSLFSFACLSLLLVGFTINVAAQYQPAYTIGLPYNRGFITISPDGNTILTGGTELALWDLKTGNCLRKYPDDGFSRFLLYSPNGEMLAAAYPIQYSPTVCIKMWDLKRGEVLFTSCYDMNISSYSQSENKWLAMAFSPDGKTLLTGDFKGTLVEWDTETGIEIRRLDLPSRYPRVLYFLPSGKQIIASHLNMHVSLYDLETGENLYKLPGLGMSLSEDRTRLLVNGGGNIHLYNAATGDVIQSIPSEDLSTIGMVALSPDGNLGIVAGSEERYPLKVLDMNTGEVLRTYPDSHGGLIGFSRDGKYFLRAEPGRLLLYDISDLAAGVKKAGEYDKRE